MLPILFNVNEMRSKERMYIVPLKTNWLWLKLHLNIPNNHLGNARHNPIKIVSLVTWLDYTWITCNKKRKKEKKINKYKSLCRLNDRNHNSLDLLNIIITLPMKYSTPIVFVLLHNVMYRQQGNEKNELIFMLRFCSIRTSLWIVQIFWV